MSILLDKEVILKASLPVSGALSLIPDSLLSFAGKVLLAVILAGITFLTNKLLEVWWNKRKKKK